MADSATIRFYFDVISHNAYIAWTQIPELAQRHRLTVEPVPVLFAGLLAANNQLGPAEIRPKAVWMVKDVIRKARRLGIALAPPFGHPFNPLLALRACCLDLDEAARRDLIDGLFRAAWAESRDISNPEEVDAIANAAGLDGADVVRQSSTAPIKKKLRDSTEEASALGVFGVPTMIVRGALFWGFDDFEHLEMFLDGNDPLAGTDLARWSAVRPTSWRRQAPCQPDGPTTN